MSVFLDLLTVKGGQKLSYGHREPWKVVKEKHGTTHPARKRKQDESDDGRAPDTTKKLSKSFKTIANSHNTRNETTAKTQMIKRTANSPPTTAATIKPFAYMETELHKDELRLFRDKSVQTYPWNTNSCWLDSSLDALFACFIHLKKRFTYASLEYKQSASKLMLLSEHFQRRLNIYRDASTVPQIQSELFDLRNELAKNLNLDLTQQRNPLVTLYNF